MLVIERIGNGHKFSFFYIRKLCLDIRHVMVLWKVLDWENQYNFGSKLSCSNCWSEILMTTDKINLFRLTILLFTIISLVDANLLWLLDHLRFGVLNFLLLHISGMGILKIPYGVLYS